MYIWHLAQCLTNVVTQSMLIHFPSLQKSMLSNILPPPPGMLSAVMLNSEHSCSALLPLASCGDHQEVCSSSSIFPCLAMPGCPHVCAVLSLPTPVFLTFHIWHFLTFINVTSHLHNELQSPHLLSVFSPHSSIWTFTTYFPLLPTLFKLDRLSLCILCSCAPQSLCLYCPIDGNVLLPPSSTFSQCLRFKFHLSSFHSGHSHAQVPPVTRKLPLTLLSLTCSKTGLLSLYPLNSLLVSFCFHYLGETALLKVDHDLIPFLKANWDGVKSWVAGADCRG